MIWLLQNVVFSISLIVILHYLYIYFKATLTSPRVKDLIHCPKQKYETLFDTIQKGNRDPIDDYDSIIPKQSSLGIPNDHNALQSQYNMDNMNNNNTPQYNQPQLMNDQQPSNDTMKTELKAYLKTLGLKKNSSHNRSASNSNGMIT
jgi:hypothetical protein